MRFLTLLFLFSICTSCVKRVPAVQATSIELKFPSLKKVIQFENQNAIFYADLQELFSLVREIKLSDTAKYRNNSIEIDRILLFKITERDSLRIFKDALFKTFITEGFIQSKLEKGETLIFDKRNHQNIRSIRISRPYKSHSSTFQAFLDNEKRQLIFEREIIMVSR